MYKILANLPFKTNHVHYLSSCHSTNEVAQDLLQSDVSEGTVVITDDQFAGKGHAGNKWRSLRGQNLTFSIILRPVFLMPNEQFLITVILSLGIKEALEEILPGQVKIKWPNDIFYDNKKIAGLLIENVLRGNTFDSCIAGIGVNVNQTDFPDDIRATSLKLSANRDFDLNTILNGLMKNISAYYLKLQEGNGNILKERYKLSMLALGEERRFMAKEEEFMGIIKGTDEYGRLLVEKDKEVMVFQHKEVEMLF